MTTPTFGVVLSPEHLKMARDDALLSDDKRRQNGMPESPQHREYRALLESALKSASGHSSGQTDSIPPPASAMVI
jgi:hypothetical protein